MIKTKFLVLIFLFILAGFASANSNLGYKVQLRWVPELNALSISQNAMGLPPDCEECYAPIEWIKCGYNTEPGLLENGDDACFTIDDDAGFGIRVKLNNAANCTSDSQPYKTEWANFVYNLPNGVTGVKVAHMNPISELTTVSITCDVGTQPLSVLKVQSIPLNKALEDAVVGSLYFESAYSYDLLYGNQKHHNIKTTMDVMKSKRVEYRIRQHETDIFILASTSREPIEVGVPKSHVNPRYDLWMFISDYPIDMDNLPPSVNPIDAGKCDSLASNNKDNLVALNISSSGDKGTCALDGESDYWLVWYILDKEAGTK